MQLLARAACSLAGAALLTIAAPLAAQRAHLTVPLPELESRVRRDSMDPVAHYDVGIGYWVHKRYAAADSALRRAVAIEPKLAAGYLALAYLPYAQRPKLWEEERKGKVPPEWADAVTESDRNFRRAFLLDPLVDLKVIGLVVPPREAIVIGRNATEAYAVLVQGFESFWGGQYSQAFAYLDAFIAGVKPAERPKLAQSILWYHGLAAAHVDQHRVAAADFQLLLDQAIERERTDSLVRFSLLRSNEIRYVLATVQQQAGWLDPATRLYEEALENDLSLYMAHAQLANIHEQNKNWTKAVAERRRALEVFPEDPSLVYDLGTTLARARSFAEAATTLEQAMALNPHNPRVPYMLGLVRQQLGDRAGARAAYERFLSIAPSRFAAQVTEVGQRLAGLN